MRTFAGKTYHSWRREIDFGKILAPMSSCWYGGKESLQAIHLALLSTILSGLFDRKRLRNITFVGHSNSHDNEDPEK
jgi:hypothetical protein